HFKGSRIGPPREPSRSRRGHGWDNAVAESFFSSLKKERIKKHIYITQAMGDSDEYIETFYHRIRRRSHLSRVSPEAFEAVSNNA
ncbi:MAG: IS3 family transposase, partial [Nitrospira sp.]|nr:IS3 family transposase [Nitrospira sp.]